MWTAGAAENPFAVDAPSAVGRAVGLQAGLARLSLTLGSQAGLEVSYLVRLKGPALTGLWADTLKFIPV